jgi:hypothetical protein
MVNLGLTSESEGSASTNRSRSAGQEPENAFCRLESLRAETHKPNERVRWMTSAPSRTDSPSFRSCPASGRASSFFPASALLRRQVLRPLGGQDARCVQPTSATCLDDVYPYLVRSRLAAAVFTARMSRGDSGSTRHDRGTRCFTTPETASADRQTDTRKPRSRSFESWSSSVGVFFPRRPMRSSLWHPCRFFLLRRNDGVAFALRSLSRASDVR